MRALILTLYDQVQEAIVDNHGDRAILRIGFERTIQAVLERYHREDRELPDEQEMATNYLAWTTPQATHAIGGQTTNGVTDALTGPLANMITELAVPDEIETQTVAYKVYVHAADAAPPAQRAVFTEDYFRHKFSYNVIGSPLRALEVYNRQCSNAPKRQRLCCTIL